MNEKPWILRVSGVEQTSYATNEVTAFKPPQLDKRQGKPYVVIDCAAFQSTHGEMTRRVVAGHPWYS